MDKFFGMGGMPDVIGCIGCTHMPIIRPPGSDPETFRCRKGSHSIKVQAVCGPDLSFYNVSHWPGSVSDMKIFEDSNILAALEEGSVPGHLLGNKGYSCQKYLLTPLHISNGKHEKAYNRSHIQTHSTIEKAFSILKKRFVYLTTPMRTKLDTTKAIIVASVVLHNVAIHSRIDVLKVDDLTESHFNEMNSEENVNMHEDDASILGHIKRQRVIKHHF